MIFHVNYDVKSTKRSAHYFKVLLLDESNEPSDESDELSPHL